MGSQKMCYACYKGDKLLEIGSKKRMSEYLGVSKRTVENYCHAWHHRNCPNGVNLYAVGPLEPWEK